MATNTDDILATLERTHATLESRVASSTYIAAAPSAESAALTPPSLTSNRAAASTPSSCAAPLADGDGSTKVMTLRRAAEQQRKLAQLLPDDTMRDEMLSEARKLDAQADALARPVPPPSASAMSAWSVPTFEEEAASPAPALPPAPVLPESAPTSSGWSELPAAAASCGASVGGASPIVRAVLRRDSAGLFKLVLREAAGLVVSRRRRHRRSLPSRPSTLALHLRPSRRTSRRPISSGVPVLPQLKTT